MSNKYTLLQDNSKLKRDKIKAINLPCKLTCPFADICKRHKGRPVFNDSGECTAYQCYASKGLYNGTRPKEHSATNWEITKLPEFAQVIQPEIDRFKGPAIRLHTSGDFYNGAYVTKWVSIARANPNKLFYAYTKSIPYFLKNDGTYFDWIPNNLKVIFSYGGKYDHLIDRSRHAHAVIFRSRYALRKAKYIDCSDSDLKALKSVMKNKLSIGLVYH